MSIRLRNTLIFIVAVNIVAWITTYLATKVFINNFILEQLFIIIFLMSPFLTSYVLRSVGKDRWDNAGIKFRFKRSIRWYIVSILIFPIIIVITYLLSALFSSIGETASLSSVLITSIILLIPMYFKNIGEEFGWRGYLEPQLKDLGISRIYRHTTTGIIWAVWHLPIIFLSEYTTESMLTYLPRFFLGTIIFAFVYGQLRDYSKTVWTAVLLHTIGNSIGNTFISSYNFASHKYYGIVPESYVSMIIWIFISVIIYAYHKKISVN